MHQTFDHALEVNLLHANQAGADHNRAHLDAWGVTCLNFMSGPGAGKTSLLERTLHSLTPALKVAVIEGDMTTDLDAQRLRQCRVPVIAINTGRCCHLDAKMVAGGLRQWAREHNPAEFDLLFVENVGNLVCPAEFAVGEHAKVALLSITEGEDKPLKYPLMFQQADCLVVTKLDLAPYLQVDLDRIIAHVRQINPQVPIFPLSAQTGVGFSPWLAWLHAQLSPQIHEKALFA